MKKVRTNHTAVAGGSVSPGGLGTDTARAGVVTDSITDSQRTAFLPAPSYQHCHQSKDITQLIGTDAGELSVLSEQNTCSAWYVSGLRGV